MQDKKNILICLEGLNIGGVETYVVNQAIALKNAGHNVIVLAKKGIYTEKLIKNGIQQVDIEFKLQNNIDLKLKDRICNIIKENKVDQVHIHQLPCVLSAWFACITLNIPYVHYLHSEKVEVVQWFEENYSIFKNILQNYFKNATKIICITEMVKDRYLKYYNKLIEKNKFIVLNNSINFEEFSSKTNVKEIVNFLIISRFSEEKMKTIKNGIDLYIEYVKKTKNEKQKYSLKIVGDGEYKSEIQEYINQFIKDEYNIKILESTNNVASEIEKTDVLIGIGRCILEAIAMKRIAIISGREELKILVNQENIDKAIDENFVAMTFKDNTKEEISTELLKLTSEKIIEIVDDNYFRIKEKLDINNNLYFIENIDNIKYNILDSFINIVCNIQENLNNEVNKSNEIWQEKVWLEKEHKELIIQINKIKEENKELLKLDINKKKLIDKLEKEKIIGENNNDSKFI